MADETYPDNPAPPPYVDQGYEQTKAIQGYSSGGVSLGSLRNPPVRRVVEQQIVELKAQLEEREKLLAALDAEPGVEKILDHMRKMNI